MIAHSLTPSVMALAALAGAAQATTPLPPCEGILESGMTISIPDILGHDQSGVMIESYADRNYQKDPPAPEVLAEFVGTRVLDCRSGRFLTIEGRFLYDKARAALPATEFLRGDVQAGKRLQFDKVLKAANALYPGKIRTFRETDETCSCNYYFPEERGGKPAYGGHAQ